MECYGEYGFGIYAINILNYGEYEARDMEKVSGNSLNTATASTGTNALPLPTGAEERAARKLMELEAGRVLVAQAAKQAEETRERLEEERQDSKEKEPEREQRDTSELSRQSKWFGLEGKLLEEANLKWILEMEQELWEELLNWYPTPTGNLSRQLEELSRLYLALLEAVLTHTTGQEQNIQLERLDAELSQKLNLVLEVRLNNLITLLERMGQRETLGQIRYSLYKQVTGENISHKEAERFFAVGRQATKSGGSGTISKTVFGTAGRTFAEEGSVYQSCGGRSVRVSQGFDDHRRSGEIQMSQRNFGLSEGRSGDGIVRVFSGEELVRADDFAKHLNASSQLLERMGTVKGNQEAAGYLAALTAIKGEIFLSGSGRSGAMATPMKSLIDQMVDYYLNQKGAYEAYYYTTGIYEKTKNPQKAAEEGLAYAYRLFLEKKENASYKEQAAYSEEAGFFQMLSGRTLEEDFRRGARLLEENWKDFLSALGQEGRSISLRLQRYSPWGAMMEAEERRKARDQKAEQLFLKQALVVAAVILLYMLGRHIF